MDKQWHILQMDVNNVCVLHGELKETPLSFNSINKGKIWKLHKVLYGLKQVPRFWFYNLNPTLLQLDFHVARVILLFSLGSLLPPCYSCYIC